MPRPRFLLALFVLATAAAQAQKIDVYQTTPDLLEALSHRADLHFTGRKPDVQMPVITVDDGQRFQKIDGFGASLTDAAAWLFAKKLSPEQTDKTFEQLFSPEDGIGLSFLRQPAGSSDLAVTFYSFDDLCQQSTTACTTPAGVSDPQLEHFSLAHDEEYILPLLKKAVALNPNLHIMLSPWSPPGWMKTTRSMLGSNPETKEESHLKPEFYAAFAQYLVKTIQGYQAAGVPVWAISVQNEPLFAPPTYSGMHMDAEEQAKFLGEDLGPALKAAQLSPKVMVYDHNWNRPDYPETVLKDPKAGAMAAGTAWHHYEGDPSVMTTNHEEFPDKGQWVTESSGGTWQKGLHDKGNILAEEAAELIAVMRNWSQSYVLWALATDQNHGPHVGGCDTCRGLVTIDLTSPKHPRVKHELDFYVLGHASKFLESGAVRIASNEPDGTSLKDVAFSNPGGSIVLYVLNEGQKSRWFRIRFHEKTAATLIPRGSVATFIWKP
ncbi:MAG TPA: glycoside hydrolase family 30 beta sandwich domain-containing protein [Terracidiphilus sp.]|nr:glycoside hydrolase family 30 beta sandwich domain-containing protein [Terracidiphilus sp.]